MNNEAKMQDVRWIFRSRPKKQPFLLRSICVQRFGRGRLTAEGATPQKFRLPHLFTCWRKIIIIINTTTTTSAFTVEKASGF